MTGTWRRLFGDEGEELAAKHLQASGMKIIDWQWSVKGGEIDLVGQEGNEIVFIEVKSRRNREFGDPEEAVTPDKIRRILRAAHAYLQARHWEDRPWRLDVVAIEWRDGQEPAIRHLRAIDIPESLW
jgi:putative endonuclease